jgi:hypothetical protein
MVPVVHTPHLLELYYLPLVQEIRVELKHIFIDTTITESSISKNMSNAFHSLFTKTEFPKLEGIDFAWNDDISLMDCEYIINCGDRSKNFKTLILKINIDINPRASYNTYSHLIRTSLLHISKY